MGPPKLSVYISSCSTAYDMNSSPASGEKMNPCLLSVVIPAHNERESILHLVGEAAVHIRAVPFEIVVVDDGSDDGAGQLLLQLADEVCYLRVVCLPRRYGQSTAVLRGVQAARGRWIATMDGDGQNDPSDIMKLLDLAMRRTDAIGEDRPVLVAGRRVRRQDSLKRRLVSRLMNELAARALGPPLVDKGCGLKVFQRAWFLRLPRFDHMHRFLPALFGLFGAEILSMPVNHLPREHGSSHYSNLRRIYEGFVDVAGITWLRWRYIDWLEDAGASGYGPGG
jgi:dolichol-phosphate mannosyltransferase